MNAPLIVVLGPTAVGKTGLAIDMALQLNGEIIGADSRQIYRFMDIGTAKPTPEERSLVPHHLIDIVDPDTNLGLASFQKLVYATIADVHHRRRIPFLVGGTGQYISAVTEGWTIPEIPPQPELRAELENYAVTSGALALHARLRELDPQAAEHIHPHNIRRIVRAIEVHQVSGIRFSELQKKNKPPYRILELGLTLDRPLLYERADHRVDVMIQTGFVDEVRRLLELGYSRTLASMSGLGYAQLAAHILDGVPLDQAVYDTKIATHDFIRRQLTWFRGHDNGIIWHNVQHTDTLHRLVDLGSRWLVEQN